MSRIRVRVEGHYEVRKVPYGKDYIWTPAHALIECDCGQMIDADEQHAVCPNCDTDHTAVVRQVVREQLPDETLHPWHPDYAKWRAHRKREGHVSEFDELE